SHATSCRMPTPAPVQSETRSGSAVPRLGRSNPANGTPEIPALPPGSAASRPPRRLPRRGIHAAASALPGSSWRGTCGGLVWQADLVQHRLEARIGADRIERRAPQELDRVAFAVWHKVRQHDEGAFAFPEQQQERGMHECVLADAAHRRRRIQDLNRTFAHGWIGNTADQQTRRILVFAVEPARHASLSFCFGITVQDEIYPQGTAMYEHPIWMGGQRALDLLQGCIIVVQCEQELGTDRSTDARQRVAFQCTVNFRQCGLELSDGEQELRV